MKIAHFIGISVREGRTFLVFFWNFFFLLYSISQWFEFSQYFRYKLRSYQAIRRLRANAIRSMRQNSINRANRIKHWHKIKEFRSQSIHAYIEKRLSRMESRSDSVCLPIVPKAQRSKSVKIMTNTVSYSGIMNVQIPRPENWVTNKTAKSMHTLMDENERLLMYPPIIFYPPPL